ncbi:MAG: EthD domain-containing protein [Dehalococcoidia bacterium]
MPKIKMFAAIPRKPGVSAQEFHDHWRHPHGTMGRRISILRKYVQGHQIDSDQFDAEQRRYEGIAEAWLDSIDDALLFPNEPVYATRVIPDEPFFIDLPNLKFIITQEDVVVSQPRGPNAAGTGNGDWFDDDRSVNIKWVQLIEVEGAEPWHSDRDGDLGDRIGAFRHVRCFPVKEIHGSEPPFLGVRELWWPTVWAFREGIAADRAAFDQLVRRPARAVNVLVHAERFK